MRGKGIDQAVHTGVLDLSHTPWGGPGRVWFDAEWCRLGERFSYFDYADLISDNSRVVEPADEVRHTDRIDRKELRFHWRIQIAECEDSARNECVIDYTAIVTPRTGRAIYRLYKQPKAT